MTRNLNSGRATRKSGTLGDAKEESFHEPLLKLEQRSVRRSFDAGRRAVALTMGNCSIETL